MTISVCFLIFYNFGKAKYKDQLRRSAAKLLVIDSTWYLEEFVFRHAMGKGSNDELANRALAILPTDTKHVSMDEAIAAVEQLQSSSLYQFCNDSAKAITLFSFRYIIKIFKNTTIE